MLKIYGSKMCPDCVQCKNNFDLNGIKYEFLDICDNLSYLSAFLKLRDSEPVFDRCKEIGDIGLPAVLNEDGTLFIDWEGYLKEKGLEISYENTGSSCSMDRKGC